MAEEVELTLRVASQDPEGLFRDITARPSLGRTILVPRGVGSMHDRYFDTPDSSLMKGGYALRLRTKGGRTLLALKGREKRDEQGGISRLEIEGPWARETISRVDRELGTALGQAFDPGDPAGSLRAMGFVPIQSRETTRTLLDVVSGPGSEPVCELALDRVRYEAAGKAYLHYEVEIELKAHGRQGLLQGMRDCLRQAYPGALEPWDYNKLVTGFALEALIRQGEPDPGDGVIPPSWYDKMAVWIRERRTCA
ncbi:MAG TPA: CYTH domain-containing protein [Deltaproteobacteria bacterium]|nr:CYTH domain-containing protein [Deltaproteobacteria bacterium]HOI06944.1 CYTH domain-containing protein [Deltaproteobacteria bacterium]